MGMFDHYRPQPSLHCPQCGSELAGWQGKEGPCNLVIWRQGAAAPTGHEVDEERRLPRRELDQLRLPAIFRLYTDCSCGSWVVATGFGQDETWTEVALGEFETRASVPATSFGDGVRQCSRCAHVWSTGDPIALAGCPSCARLTELAGG